MVVLTGRNNAGDLAFRREDGFKDFSRKGLFCNASRHSREKDIKEFCQIDEHGEDLLKMVYDPIGSIDP